MLNPIWLALVLLSVFLGGFTGKLGGVTAAALESSKNAVTLALSLAGMFALFLGIMRLAELSGLVNILARGLKPITRRLFPDIPADHPVMGAVAMNVASNMLGLGNASTPLGLKAMRGLEKLNPRPGIASNAMCTFLAMNTASVQLIPTTAVSILAMAGAKNPWAIIGSAFAATLCANLVGLTSVKLLEKLPAYRLPPIDPSKLPEVDVNQEGVMEEQAALPVEAPRQPLTRNGLFFLALYGIGIAAMFLTLAFPEQFNAFLSLLHPKLGTLPPLSADLARMGLVSRLVSVLSLIALPVMFTFFPLYARLRGVKVYEEFVEGAKEGFQVAVRIIPYLVAILVAVGMFRAAGGIALIATLLGPLLLSVGFPVDLLPLVLVRPLSGSATTALFTDVVKNFGPDSLTSLTAGTIFGSTETTFYVIAVYFGSVGIRRTRHAVPAGLMADTAGVIASIVICKMMFG